MKKYYLIIGLIFFTTAVVLFLQRPKMEIVHPKTGPIIESVYAISTVKSEWYYSLKLGVLSTVDKYFAKEGDLIKEGDKLLYMSETNSIFRSPHDGIVTYRPFGVKETIAPNTPILNIVDLKIYIWKRQLNSRQP